MAKKGGLGKGLDALFADNSVENNESVLVLDISEIEPNKEQPRTDFDNASLVELADSITQFGVLQPILVRPIIGGYQIIAGERRYRASQMAGLSQVPVIVRQIDDKEVMQIALIENLQREDLSPIEAARGYEDLMKKHGLTQDEVANVIGKSRPAITNSLRLLQLPNEVINFVSEGKLSQGHARSLLAIPKDEIVKVAQDVMTKGLSVRETEKLAKNYNKPKKDNQTKKRITFFDEVEIALKEQLGRKVKVTGEGEKGTLTISFYNLEELQDIAKRLGRVKASDDFTGF